MKKLLLYVALTTTLCGQVLATGDSTALQPNISREQRWQEYEGRRLKKMSLAEKITELFYEWKESIKHSFLIDILFFKNNRVETEFCEELLAKFDLDLSQVTVLSKPLDGTPACTAFNTIIVDHDKMSKLTADEQAFIMGHEIVHLKSKDWATRMLFGLLLQIITYYGIKEITKALPTEGPHAAATKAYVFFCSWFASQIYLIAPLTSWLSRYQEKRCDIVSAKTLGLARAGASAFEKIRKKWILRQEAPMNPNGIWYNWLTTFGLYNSHPELHDRTTYLLKLADEQEQA